MVWVVSTNIQVYPEPKNVILIGHKVIAHVLSQE